MTLKIKLFPVAPRIQASGIQVASVGETVELKCTIKSKPIPKTMFWRDLDGRIPVINSGNYDMTMMNDVEVCISIFSRFLEQFFMFHFPIGSHHIHNAPENH